MNKYAFLTDQSCKGTEIAEGSGRVVAANAKQSEPRAYYGPNRSQSRLQDMSFSLTIRTDDGPTLLETRVENMHHSFQRLIDWSLGEAGYDVSAAIKGPNGFYTNNQIKASGGFAWIECDET
jgi:hypothetical protein